MNARISSMFRALKSRNYRLFFAGQSISLVGTWMQQVALSWMVYRMTHSALLLGIVGFSGQIPGFFVTPFAGIFSDRYNRRRMLIVTQSAALAQSAVLAVLVLSGHIVLWHVIVLAAILGLVHAFDIPIRQAFTIEMIEKKEDLGNAIALNSSMFNAARLLGPSIAGILIAVAGEGVCFSINAVSYVAVILSLAAMKVPRKKKGARAKNIMHELREGVQYAFGFKPIRSILTLLAMISLMGVSYQVLMPVFARDIFHGGPRTLGVLVAMAGFGALAGALYLAMRTTVVGLGRVIAVTTGMFGVGIMCFSFSNVLWFSMAMMAVCGFGIMVQMASCNTILQTIVDEDKRGRVMSFYTLAFMGTVPFGSLFAGLLAHKIGAQATVMLSGVTCTIGAFMFARHLPELRRQVRPVYEKMGIIPE